MKRVFLVFVLCFGCSASPALVEPALTPTPDEPTDVVAELKQACAQDDPGSCLNLALRFERGEGVPIDVKAASKLYDKACELNNAHACYGKGMLLLYEDNNPIQAHLLFEHTCDSKHWPSCVALGDLYRDGTLLRRDEKKALGLYQKACDGGYQIGCNAYIKMVWTASDQLIPLQEFVRGLEDSCGHRHAPSCEELSKLYAEGVRWAGDDLKVDVKKAKELRKRAAQLRRVAVSKDSYDVEVDVPKGQVVTHEEANSPPNVPFKPGFIVVSGEAGGKIFVDGVETGRLVPGKVLVVQGGPHQVRVHRTDGTLSSEKLVFVGSGQNVAVSF